MILIIFYNGVIFQFKLKNRLSKLIIDILKRKGGFHRVNRNVDRFCLTVLLHR